jgi:hypothetical protein
VFKFVAEAGKNGVKPIVGCEFYVVEDRHIKQFTKEKRDQRFHQLLLAKNAEGYKNLVKLCSLGYIEGLYSKWPRIDKELILKHHKGLIATTCCLGASVPQTILKKDAALGDLRALMRRYVKGDPEITDQQMAQQIDRTRHLVSSMLGALAVTSRGFVKRYQTRYSPDAVKDIVKMEGGLGAFGNEGKYWRKYVELSSDISEVSIQTDMMESISRFVEDMMKTKKPGSPA